MVHRKLLLDTVEQDNTELLEDIMNSHTKRTAYDYIMALIKNIRQSQEEPVNSETKGNAEFLGRANPQGQTPLHISCMKDHSDCT